MLTTSELEKASKMKIIVSVNFFIIKLLPDRSNRILLAWIKTVKLYALKKKVEKADEMNQIDEINWKLFVKLWYLQVIGRQVKQIRFCTYTWCTATMDELKSIVFSSSSLSFSPLLCSFTFRYFVSNGFHYLSAVHEQLKSVLTAIIRFIILMLLCALRNLHS